MPGPASNRRRERSHRATRADYSSRLDLVSAAMRRVLADIEATTPYRPAMRVEFADDWPSSVVCLGLIDGRTGRAILVRPSEGVEHAAVLLADEMSEEVSEALAEDHRLTEAASWPSCPSHGHALDPVLRLDRAVWACRDDPEIEIPIGGLTAG